MDQIKVLASTVIYYYSSMVMFWDSAMACTSNSLTPSNAESSVFHQFKYIHGSCNEKDRVTSPLTI